MKIAIIIIGLLVSNLAFGQDFAQIRKLMVQEVDSNHVPSLSIAVINKGKVVWEDSYGYADKERKIASTIHTKYYLASVTKAITATAILQLAERRKIDLNKSVNHYLERYKVKSKLWNLDSVTIRKVLAHTAGFTTHDRDCFINQMTCPISMDTTIYRYANIYWEPGKKFDYSNIGYQVLGEIIKDRSKMSLSNYFEKEIFKPLGMKNSFLAENTFLDEVAIRYKGGKPFNPSMQKISNTPAGSSAYSSVHDLARFALLHLGLQGNKTNILSLNAIFLKEKSINNDFGWWINQDYFGYKSYQAQGGTTDAQSSIRLIPSEGIAVIVLANSGHANGTLITNEVLAILLNNFKENFTKNNQQKRGPSSSNAPKEELSAFLKGQWVGEIETYNGSVPIQLCLSCNNENYAVMSGEKKIIQVKYSNGTISFNLMQNLPIKEDMSSEPYSLNIYLSQKDAFLYGLITTNNIDYNNAPRLSYWIKLLKNE